MKTKKLLSLLLLSMLCSIGNVWGDITCKTITSSTGEVYDVTPATLYSYYNGGDGWVTNASGGEISSNSYYSSKTGGNNTNYINPETEESGTKAQASGITLKTADNRSARFYFTGAVKATAFIAATGSSRTATITVYKVSDDSSVGSKTGTNYSASGPYEKLEVTGLSASESYYAKVTATNDLCLYAMKFFAEANYDITLDGNGEYQGNGSAKVAPNGTSLTNITAPKRTGYSVSGYYAEAGCETKIAEANGTLLANKTGFTDADGKWTATEGKTLYAAWEAGKYTLTIVPNEAGYGSVSPTSVANIPYNTATSSSSNTFTVNGTTVTATATDATAEYTYAFSGWTDLPTNVTEDATVTATFTRTPKSYTLAWDGNGDGATLSGEYTDGSTPFGTTIVKPTATRTGYVLAGWATTADGDVVDVTTMPAVNTTYFAKWTEAVAPTFNVNYTNISTPQNVGVTFTASNVTGTPAPTITWYQSATAVASGGTSKGTGTSYAPAVSTVGTYYFYAVASNGIDPDANSGVITLTVAPKLNSLVYSNGFKAFIQQPSVGHGTIKAYYIAGTDAPTISSFTATTGATYNVVGNTLTLTAADGVTAAVFDITLEPVIPFSGTGEYTFTAGDTWVKSGNNSFSSGSGWKVSRSLEDDANKKFMISTGGNRAYLFLAPSTSVVITKGGTKRAMQGYVNGTANGEESSSDDATVSITGDEDAPYMVEIAQTTSGGGDGYIKSVTITKTGFESGIISAAGWSTFSSSNKLDLSQVTGGTAYVASAAEGSTVTLKAVSDKIVAAGEGLMIKGTANAAFKIATTSEAVTFSGDNLLQGQTTTGDVAASVAEGIHHYVFGFNTANPSTYGFYNLTADTEVAAGKAYLETAGAINAPSLRIVEDENNATNIYNLDASETAVKFIQNGALYILRDGVVYDALGRIVR